MATTTTYDPSAYWLKLLSRRYNAWCNWNAKFEVYWEASVKSRPLLDDGTPDYSSPAPCPVPYPKGRPSKNSKYSAYDACAMLRREHGIEISSKDLGTVREWRAVLVAMGRKRVKPLPKCNRLEN